jgi:hypothetical protein
VSKETHTIIDKPDKLNAIKIILQQLVGKCCWRVSCSYGGEYILDIGPKRPSVVVGKERGEWMLCTDGTGFKITDTTKGNVIFDGIGKDTDNEEVKRQIEQAFSSILDQPITDIQVDYASLTIIATFNGQIAFEIVPTKEDDEIDLPYWSLLAGDEKRLEMGPGRILFNNL